MGLPATVVRAAMEARAAQAVEAEAEAVESLVALVVGAVMAWS